MDRMRTSDERVRAGVRNNGWRALLRCAQLVHDRGTPCDLDEIYRLAREHDLAVIEDCAHACGASYRGQPIGSHDGMQAFSFQAVKNLTLGDGGALTVASAGVDARLRRLRWSGIDRSTFERSAGAAYHWEYEVTEVGM